MAGGWTWEQALGTVLEVTVPGRDTISAPSWLYLSTDGPKAGGDTLVFTAPDVQPKVEVYFAAATVEGAGSNWATFVTVPDTTLAGPVATGQYGTLMVNPRTFGDVSAALTIVTDWLGTTSGLFTDRRDGIDTHGAGFQGSAAMAFRNLVGNVGTALADLNDQLAKPGESYSASVTASGQAARTFLTDLWNAFQAWQGVLEHRPNDAVLSVVRELAVTNETTGTNEIHPTTKYGDMTTEAAWAAVETEAKTRWKATLDSLDTAANAAVTTLGTQYETTAEMLAPLTRPTMAEIVPEPVVPKSPKDVSLTDLPPGDGGFGFPQPTDHLTIPPLGDGLNGGRLGDGPPVGSPGNGGPNLVTAQDTAGGLGGAGAGVFVPTALTFPPPAAAGAAGAIGAVGPAATGTIGAPALLPARVFGGPFVLASATGAGLSGRAAARAHPAGFAIGAVSPSDSRRQARIRTGIADGLGFAESLSGVVGREQPPDGALRVPAGTGLAGNVRAPGVPVRASTSGLPDGARAMGRSVQTGLSSTADPVAGQRPLGSLYGLGGLGAGGSGPGADQKERERLAWCPEDEEYWGTEPDGADPAVGRVPSEEIDPEREFIEESAVDAIGRTVQPTHPESRRTG